MKKKIQGIEQHIVFLGESGFPEGLATIQRMTLMARTFIFSGCKATVICRKGVHTNNKNFPRTGKFEGIDYQYTSDSIYKPTGFINRNIQKLKGIFGEYRSLVSLKKNSSIDLIIISDLKIIHNIRYYLYSKFLGVPIVTNLVEMAASRQHKTSLFQKINDSLLDRWCIRFFDGALPISDALFKYYNKIAPSRPNLKLPVLCDFKKFDIPKSKSDNYFLYCGSFRYTEIREFIVKAYEHVGAKDEIKLYMIISGGSQRETLILENDLKKRLGSEQIKLFSNIPYQELINLYRNAFAMLIPLRPTVQDTSRFPHKIGEYLASGNLIITTNVGEIKNYFEDGKTAYIAESYDVNEFAKKMNQAIEDPKKSAEIGLLGKQMGLKEFDFRAHATRLKKFVNQFANSNR